MKIPQNSIQPLKPTHTQFLLLVSVSSPRHLEISTETKTRSRCNWFQGKTLQVLKRFHAGLSQRIKSRISTQGRSNIINIY